MTQIEFINKIREIYINARNCKFIPKNNSEILKRGTSHSISSETEDLFGCYCAEKVKTPSKISILIDPPISFKGTKLKNKSGKKSLLIRPDIVFINNGFANCFFDLKTDLGYKRHELLNQAIEKDELLEKIKGQPAKYKDGKTKNEFRINISKDIKFIYIVLSSGNIRSNKLIEYVNGINKLNNIEIYILSTGEHLNSYSLTSDWVLNKSDFDKLDVIITNKLK